MSQEHLSLIFDRLHKHRHLIGQVYVAGQIERTPENERDVDELRNSKLLLQFGSDTYRLNRHLKRLIDASISRHRAYEISGDIRARIETLNGLVEAYSVAFREGRVESADDFEDEIAEVVFDIGESIKDDVARFRAAAESKFATCRTLAEKRQQNRFYTSQAKALTETIEALYNSDLLERVEGFAGPRKLLEFHLLRPLRPLNESLIAVTQMLQRFMHEIREIEARTNRVRALHGFLRRNPGFIAHDWDESERTPEWICRAEGCEIVLLTDIAESDHLNDLAEIARGIRNRAAPARSDAPVEEPARFVEAESRPVRVLQPAHRLAIRAYLACVHGSAEAVSARRWYRARPDVQAILDLELWLECVMLECTNILRRQRLLVEDRRPPARFVDAHIIDCTHRAQSLIPTNRQVFDIEMWSRPGAAQQA